MSDTDFTPLAVWPAEHRAALIVVIHVDASDKNDVRDGMALGRDYTATGLPRLIRICDDVGIEATTAWTSRALATHPQLARSAHERGHEIAWSIASQSAEPGQVLPPEILARISGQTASGYIESLPIVGGEDHGTVLVGTDAGAPPVWVISSAGGDTPVIVRGIGTDQSGVQIPVSPYWIDVTWLHPQHPAPPSSLLEMWSASLASVRAEGGLMTVILHPHVAGRPGFADTIVRFLDEAIASGDVWIARADQVALWWKSSTELGS